MMSSRPHGNRKMVDFTNRTPTADESTNAQASAKMGKQDTERQKPRLHVTIVAGDHAVYDGPASQLIAPAVGGQITILSRHAPLLAALEPGELTVRTDDQEETLAVGGGFIEVRDDQVVVLADTAERAEEIDVARAEAARLRARLLVARYRDRPESVEAWRALRRSRVRLRVAQKARRHLPRRS